jgi:acetyl-CoA synthetase
VTKSNPSPEGKMHDFSKTASLNEAQYRALYEHSIQEPDKFWAHQAKEFITWSSPWQQVTQGDFNSLDIGWFIGGKLNACFNCLDRHLEKHRHKVALIYEGNDPTQARSLTFEELFHKVSTFANVLKAHGINKGDRVCIYLPMIPEAVIAMLASARIGAVHSVVFGGFSENALKNRILDADCRILITADGGMRGSKSVLYKNTVDKALQSCPNITQVIVVKHLDVPIPMTQGRDVWYHDIIKGHPSECPVVEMDASDPLFILYTSGSTGKPKGVLHATGGYLVYVAMSYRYVFGYHDGDVFWCTADVGWITGHSYLVYGPLLNGATTLLFDGVPNYPSYSRYWEVIDKHHVNIFYTSPTALRALRREGDEWVKKSSRQSLKLLGSVGEPINPEVWKWYFDIVGEKRCPIVNTWWQTESGGILLTQIPGATPMEPGSVGRPFFGIVPEIIDEQGQAVKGSNQGRLVIKRPWPGLMKTIFGHRERFVQAYFKESPGNYLAGDLAYQDSESNYWILGRSDDVIKVSGHRLGSGEIESALVSHPSVAEAAVVGIPNEIKGEEIYAFVTPIVQVNLTDELKKALILHVRETLGPIAAPEEIQWARALPKTRSGKIMRRILQRIAMNDLDDLGDTSTLADDSIIDELIRDRL